MSFPNATPPGQPVAVLGAGELVSHLYRSDEADDSANYRFSVFRFGESLQAVHELHPCHLPDLIKLCQVLAFAIADDGWIPCQTREELTRLVADLDALTQSWSESTETNHGES